MEKIDWICCECAMKLGGKYIEGLASYHEAPCDHCKIQKVVTQSEDYGLFFIDPTSIEETLLVRQI